MSYNDDFRSDRYRPARRGEVAEVGDIVQCMDHGYDSIRYGDTRQIQGFDESGCYILRNGSSPHGKSSFKPSNWRLLRKQKSSLFQRMSHDEIPLSILKPQETNPMLHIAIRTDNQSITNLVAELNRPGSVIDINIIAETSVQALKNRVSERIKQNNHETWLILSGNTMAAISCPPVKFTSIAQ